jgi:hypothetical protein
MIDETDPTARRSYNKGYEDALRDILERLEIMSSNKTYPIDQVKYLRERLQNVLMYQNWIRHTLSRPSKTEEDIEN